MSRTSGARLLLLVRASVAKLSHQSLVPGDEQEQRLIVLLFDGRASGRGTTSGAGCYVYSSIPPGRRVDRSWAGYYALPG
jgi:hypothetical protein